MQQTDFKNLQNMVLQAPIGICLLDATTMVAELLNDKFLEVAGKHREAIIGKFYWEPFAEVRENPAKSSLMSNSRPKLSGYRLPISGRAFPPTR